MTDVTEKISAAELGATTSERDHQRSVFEYRSVKVYEDERWEYLYANVNGQYRRGERPEPGLTAGVPDMTLAWPEGSHHGLYVELKRPGGRLTDSQEEWLERLRKAGYAAKVCYGADEAIATIERYLEGEL